MTILKTTNLTKVYSGRAVVDNVDLEIKQGDVFGLIGQNGAGKTTLMRMVTSLTSISGGSIELFGKTDAKDLQEARGRMGCVVETPAFYPNLSAVQNLEYYRIQKGIDNQQIVTEALNTVGLGNTGKKNFSNFSLGMKQRLGLALALMARPEFMILDEPTNGLDPVGIIEMRDLIKELNNRGVTMLVSSHILSELAHVINRYAIIHHGKLISAGLIGDIDGNLEDFYVNTIREARSNEYR
ncbi:MAG: ATP-binding cassette domain-containing protein [Defluviitaleaceae bacterium]|nr:ATP-binding cassette domain-containing protein [Defluviitaleaceae bacterium]